MNEENFKNIVDRLKIDDKPASSHKAALRAQMLSLFNAARQKDSKTKTLTTTFWRTIMKSPITKAAIAAVVLIIFGVIAYNHTGSIDGTSVAWADVVRSVDTVKTVYVKISLSLEDSSTPVVQCWINMPNASCTKSSHTTFGDKTLIDDGTNRLTLDETHRTAFLEKSHISHDLLTKRLSLLGIDAFREGQSVAFKFTRRAQQGGRQLIVYDLKFSGGACGTAYVDANTMLPLRIVSTDSHGVTKAEAIFDYSPISGNIFSIAIPAGFVRVLKPNLYSTVADANVAKLEDSNNAR